MNRIHISMVAVLAALMLAACNIGTDVAQDVTLTDDSTVVIITADAPATATVAPIVVADNTTADTDDTDTSTTDNDTTTTGNTTSTCVPRADWIPYQVVAGDTLSSIAQAVGSSTQDLLTGNCLTDANTLIVGQQLVLPRALSSNSGGITDHSGGICTLSITTETAVINAPQGTGRTTLGTLQQGTQVDPITRIPELDYWSIQYGDVIGWIQGVTPRGDCSTVREGMPLLSDLPGGNNGGIVGDGPGAGPSCFIDTREPFTVYAEQSTSSQSYTAPQGRYVVWSVNGNWSTIDVKDIGPVWTQVATTGACEFP